jgi:hypothetical protein
LFRYRHRICHAVYVVSTGNGKPNRIFGKPEFEVGASMSGLAFPGRLEHWAEVDATFDKIGKEPWEEKFNEVALVQASERLSTFVGMLSRLSPSQATALLTSNKETPRELLGALIHEYLVTGSFHRAGHHVFRLWPALCHALLATDLRAPLDALRLPFHGFYMHFPLAVGDCIQIDNRDGSVLPADGAYVTRPLGAHAGEAAIAVRIVSRLHPKALDVGARALTPTSNFHYYLVPTTGDEDLTMDSLRAANAKYLTKEREGLHFFGPGIQLVLNALLYVNSVNADVRWGKSERDLLQEAWVKHPAKTAAKFARRATALVQARRDRRHETGRTIRIPTLPPNDAGEKAHAAWQLQHRVQVRGHWRNQAYGPGRADRRLRWIEPHWRGPDMAEIVSRRVYEVVTPEGRVV